MFSSRLSVESAAASLEAMSNFPMCSVIPRVRFIFPSVLMEGFNSAALSAQALHCSTQREIVHQVLLEMDARIASLTLSVSSMR
jgi:hypothetical protein